MSVIPCFVFFDKIPTKNSLLKSVILSLIAFCIATIIIQVGAGFLRADALYYGFIGVMINVPRFLILGIVIGYLY